MDLSQSIKLRRVLNCARYVNNRGYIRTILDPPHGDLQLNRTLRQKMFRNAYVTYRRGHAYPPSRFVCASWKAPNCCWKTVVVVANNFDNLLCTLYQSFSSKLILAHKLILATMSARYCVFSNELKKFSLITMGLLALGFTTISLAIMAVKVDARPSAEAGQLEVYKRNEMPDLSHFVFDNMKQKEQRQLGQNAKTPEFWNFLLRYQRTPYYAAEWQTAGSHPAEYVQQNILQDLL